LAIGNRKSKIRRPTRYRVVVLTSLPNENGIMTMATRATKLVGADYIDIQSLANETGGEGMSDKPENLDTTFQTLIDHLRSRWGVLKPAPCRRPQELDARDEA
jgi:hypothetical protein